MFVVFFFLLKMHKVRKLFVCFVVLAQLTFFPLLPYWIRCLCRSQPSADASISAFRKNGKHRLNEIHVTALLMHFA